jgi:hypothetical protein
MPHSLGEQPRSRRSEYWHQTLINEKLAIFRASRENKIPQTALFPLSLDLIVANLIPIALE